MELESYELKQENYAVSELQISLHYVSRHITHFAYVNETQGASAAEGINQSIVTDVIRVTQ